MDRQHNDRFRGCLLGLAVGDAVGTAVEFETRDGFCLVTDMVGGGRFGLKPGQWTDDTSMALCLAESLIEKQGFDPRDQMARYVRWCRDGHLSSTGTCFDIGGTAAVCGQIAGAYYGESGIPAEWLEKLCMRDGITEFADRLREMGQ